MGCPELVAPAPGEPLLLTSPFTPTPPTDPSVVFTVDVCALPPCPPVAEQYVPKDEVPPSPPGNCGVPPAPPMPTKIFSEALREAAAIIFLVYPPAAPAPPPY